MEAKSKVKKKKKKKKRDDDEESEVEEGGVSDGDQPMDFAG